MRVRTPILLVLVGLALGLTSSLALAAGGPVKVSDHRLVYSAAGSLFVTIDNLSNADVTVGDPVLTGDTDVFTWAPDDLGDECSTARTTIGPFSANSECFYDFHFEPPGPGKFTATASLPVGDRVIKINLVGTA